MPIIDITEYVREKNIRVEAIYRKIMGQLKEDAKEKYQDEYAGMFKKTGNAQDFLRYFAEFAHLILRGEQLNYESIDLLPTLISR